MGAEAPLWLLSNRPDQQEQQNSNKCREGQEKGRESKAGLPACKMTIGQLANTKTIVTSFLPTSSWRGIPPFRAATTHGQAISANPPAQREEELSREAPCESTCIAERGW